MLGLRQQIGGNPVGIAGLVGQDQNFGWTGDHVDADLAEHQPLGGRDIGIAGPDDLGNGRNAVGAVGERGHRLCAADAIDLVDAGKARRGQHKRVELAVGRRNDHRQPRNAGNLGRHCIHQDRRRIGGRAAGHVKADRLDGGPFCAHLDAERVGKTIVTGLLAPVIGFNPVARELERGDRISLTGFFRGVDLRGCHAQAGLRKIDTIKFGGQLEQRTVAARHHVGNDVANRLLDVLRSLTFEREQDCETGRRNPRFGCPDEGA